jgi:hypothetical protein
MRNSRNRLKKSIDAHYSGDMDAFREWFSKDFGLWKHEDNQLFSPVRMNYDEFNLGHLTETGLAFDIENNIQIIL